MFILPINTMLQHLWINAPLLYQAYKRQSAIVARYRLAVLPGLQSDVAILITILLFLALQTLVQVSNIAISKTLVASRELPI